MEKINFEAGTQVSPAKVTIDNVEHEIIPSVWEGNTPLSPFVLNKLQDNIENAIENKRLKLEGKSEQTGEPTVANPVKIRNIGDNINLFDKSSIGPNYKYNDGLKLDRDNLRAITIILTKKIKPGKYTVSFKYGSKSTSNNFGIQFLNGSEAIINVTFTTEKRKTFTINREVDRLYFYINTAQASGIVLYLDEIKLEEGSTATPYTEYGCGSIDYEINTTQNIFNKDTDIELDGQYRNYGNGNISTNQNYYGVKVKVEKNREYKVFSYQDYSNLCYFDKDMNYLSGELFEKNTKATIFNTSSNCEYITLAVAKSGINEFSITEAKTIHFPLSEGQVIHKDDYIMNNEIHQNRKTYTITGNENWVLTTGTTNFLGIYLNDVIKDCVTNEHSINVQSNIATGVEYTNRWNSVNKVSCRGNTLTLTLNNVTTIQEAKAYLKSQYENGTPVIVEYGLAEEIVTPLTNKQTEEFYELQKAKYVDEMTLTCMNEVVPTLADIDKKLKENLLEIEENITKVEKKLKKEISESGVIVSATEPREDNRRKIWLQKGRRLFNYKTANYLLAYSNITAMQITISLSSDNHRSSYVKCKPNTTYTIEKKAGHSFRVSTTTDEPAAGVTINKSVANHEGSTINITTGENDNYIFFTCFSSVNGDTGDYLDMYKTVKVEEGKSITPNKIYILNDDNEYEEFVTD